MRDYQPSLMEDALGLSIIVPTRNRAPHLSRLLESLARLAPGREPFDIIVVDNGSTDETGDVVERFAAQASVPVWLVREPRMGRSHARNAGLRASTRAFVAFTDDDQEVSPNWIFAIEQAFRDHPDVHAVCGPVLPLWEHQPPAWFAPHLQGAAGIIDRGAQAFRVTPARWMCLPGGNMAWRKRALLDLGGFSPAYPRSQDRELTVRYLLSGETALYSPDILVYHHLDARRITKAYYRWWYATEGYMRARLGAEELFASDGRLRPIPPDAPKTFGVSRYLYRECFHELRACVAARLRLREAEAFRHEMRFLLLSSYLRRRIELLDTPGGPVMQKVGALMARALSVTASYPTAMPPVT